LSKSNSFKNLKSKATNREKDPQKQHLLALLEQEFGNIMYEVKFDWLHVPEYSDMSDELRKVYNALSSYRSYRNFINPGYLLSVDTISFHLKI
jgi:hypothetical protein